MVVGPYLLETQNYPTNSASHQRILVILGEGHQCFVASKFESGSENPERSSDQRLQKYRNPHVAIFQERAIDMQTAV